MGHEHENTDEEDPTLSDGTQLVSDFTIAEGLTQSLITQLQRALDSLSGDKDSLRTDRGEVDAELTGHELTRREAEALFVGLSTHGCAEEIPTGRAYVNYEFCVDVPAAQKILDQQLVAAAHHEQHTPRTTNDVDLVATIPEPVDLTNAEAVSHTDGRIRDLVLNADDVIRLANPYFDSGEPIIEDLASLPQRGVNTRILTRETTDPEAGLANALNALFDGLPADRRHYLDVRDLYERNSETGQQRLATHAKLIVIDDEYCYVGSANLTRHSMNQNFEFGLLLSGDDVPAVASIFDDVFEYAEPVDLPISEAES